MNVKFGGASFFGGIVIGFVAFILLNSWVNRDVPYVLTLGEQLKIVVDDIDRKKGSDLTSLDIVAKVSADKPEVIGVERAHVVAGTVAISLDNEPNPKEFRFHYSIFGSGEIATGGLLEISD